MRFFGDGAQIEEDQDEVAVAGMLLRSVLRTSEVSLRSVEQAAHRLGLVLAALPFPVDRIAVPAVVSIVLRTVYPDLYYHYLSGQVADKQVVDAVFGLAETESLRQESKCIEVEALIILSLQPDRFETTDFDKVDSPLLSQYRLLISNWDRMVDYSDKEKWHAHYVVEFAKSTRRDELRFHKNRVRDMFQSAMQVLEMVSAGSQNEVR